MPAHANDTATGSHVFVDSLGAYDLSASWKIGPLYMGSQLVYLDVGIVDLAQIPSMSSSRL